MCSLGNTKEVTKARITDYMHDLFVNCGATPVPALVLATPLAAPNTVPWTANQIVVGLYHKVSANSLHDIEIVR